MKQDSVAKSTVVCVKCQAPVALSARFCGSCGHDQSKLYLSAGTQLRKAPVIIVTGILLFAAVRVLQSGKPIGQKPDKHYSEIVGASTPAEESSDKDAALVQLREIAKAHPDDKEGWKNLAAGLIAKLQQANPPSSQMVLELIDSLREVLRIDPKDPEALLAMADASFNSQVVDKAADYYAKYLEISPNDTAARVRYGSALAMAQQVSKAQAELKSVLDKEPTNFSAAAYLSIAYAQEGQTEQAQKIGAIALKNAPSEEAKSEFSKFLEQVAKNPGKPLAPHEENPRGNVEKPSQTSAQDSKPAVENGSESDRLADLIKTNPVAGAKFSKAELKSADTLAIYMHDFPMASMPPFAKQKFFDGIKSKAAMLSLKQIQKIIFIDLQSGQEMESLALK